MLSMKGGGQAYSAKLVERDKKALPDFYKEKGLMVLVRTSETPAGESTLDVTYEITEPGVSGVGKVSIVGNRAMKLEQLKPLLSMKEGAENYFPHLLEKDENALQDFYRKNGYADPYPWVRAWGDTFRRWPGERHIRDHRG